MTVSTETLSLAGARPAQASPHILVAIASYGAANDVHLRRVLDAWRAMPFAVDIVVFSDIAKKLGSDISVRVGLPTKNPWTLPFPHKRLFVECVGTHDLFIYSEDDMLITERNLRAFLEVTPRLRDDEVAGFIRFEQDAHGRKNYPEMHWRYRWDSTSVRDRDGLTLARFTNDHAACYILTRAQLRRAIASGGFDVPPHEEIYDLLCTAATDPYTQCGLTKLIPISRINDFAVHHLPNKYVGKLGVDEAELDRQVEALLDFIDADSRPATLFETDSKLWQARHSKDFYETAAEEVVAAVPRGARVLSIGAASGASERLLIERECDVTALPLDPVFGWGLALDNFAIVAGDLATARASLGGEHFDTLLFLNVLQFVRDPPAMIRQFLSLLAPGGKVIISAPNVSRWRYLWRTRRVWGDFDSAGVYPTSAWTLRRWCGRAGLTVTETFRRPYGRRWFVPAHDLVVTARKS